MRTIRLHGPLQQFGKVFVLDVKSPAEAIRALCSQIKGFEKFLIESEKDGVLFRVLSNSEEILNKENLRISGTGDIDFIPIIAGGNAEIKGLIGLALIATSFIIPGSAEFTLPMGVGLTVNSVSEFVSRNNSSISTTSSTEENPSYIFSKPVNTVAQGHPVPVGYGRMRVGSAVISLGISTKSILAGYKYVQKIETKSILACVRHGKTVTRSDLQYQPPAGWISESVSFGGTFQNTTYFGESYDIETLDYYYFTYSYYVTVLEYNAV